MKRVIESLIYLTAIIILIFSIFPLITAEKTNENNKEKVYSFITGKYLINFESPQDRDNRMQREVANFQKRALTEQERYLMNNLNKLPQNVAKKVIEAKIKGWEKHLPQAQKELSDPIANKDYTDFANNMRQSWKNLGQKYGVKEPEKKQNKKNKK